MALRGIRSTIQRFVVVAGLTGAILVGSVAVGPQSDASAAMSYCTLAAMERAIARSYAQAGNIGEAIYHYGRADAFEASDASGAC